MKFFVSPLAAFLGLLFVANTALGQDFSPEASFGTSPIIEETQNPISVTEVEASDNLNEQAVSGDVEAPYIPLFSDYLPSNGTVPQEISLVPELDPEVKDDFNFDDEQTFVEEDGSVSTLVANPPKAKGTVYCYITKKSKFVAEHYYVFCIYRTPGENVRLLVLGLNEDSDFAHAQSLLGKNGFPVKGQGWFRFIGQFAEERADGPEGIITKATEYSNTHPFRDKDTFLLRALASPFIGYPCLEVALGVEKVILTEIKK